MNCVSYLFLDVEVGFFCMSAVHSIVSLISFTFRNSYRLFYIIFDLCLHLCFSPISTELSAGSYQSHMAIFSSFLLNPRDLCSFSASFPHPPQFPVCFRQAAPSNPWGLGLQSDHQLYKTLSSPIIAHNLPQQRGRVNLMPFPHCKCTLTIYEGLS